MLDEELRSLQRLAESGDRQARNRLYHLIKRLPPQYGLSWEIRPYRCTLCGHEQTPSTNHTSPIYGIYCMVCSWKGMRDEYGDYHEPTGRTFEYAGYELTEGWNCNCHSCLDKLSLPYCQSCKAPIPSGDYCPGCLYDLYGPPPERPGFND